MRRNGDVWIGPRNCPATRVRNGKTHTYMGHWPARRVPAHKGSHDYPEVCFRVGGKRFRSHVHRLVAFAFVPGHFQDAHVNHINGDKGDFRPENLEWITPQENTKHAWEIGLCDLRGNKNPSRKLSSRKVRIIRGLLKIGANVNELADLCGVSFRVIDRISKGTAWRDI